MISNPQIKSTTITNRKLTFKKKKIKQINHGVIVSQTLFFLFGKENELN